MSKTSKPSSGRVSTEIPCKVCENWSSGNHYGIPACDGCSSFFKRMIRKEIHPACAAQIPKKNRMTRSHRAKCKPCRLESCIAAGMKPELVQVERGPRITTLLKQNATFKENLLEEMHKKSSKLTPTMGQSPFMPIMAIPPPLGYVCPSLDFRQHLAALQQQHALFPFYDYYTFAQGMQGHTLPPMPSLAVSEHFKGTAAEQVYSNIKWIKGMPPFVELPMSDQLCLLESSFKDLLIFSLAEHMRPLDISQLVCAYKMANLNNNPSLLWTVSNESIRLQDVLNQLFYLTLDHNEYDYLRQITLFRQPILCSYGTSASDSPTTSSSTMRVFLIEAVKVSRLHEDANIALKAYIRDIYPHQNGRYNRIMAVAALSNNVSNLSIGELFFRKQIGELNISQLVCDMYLRETA